MCEGPVNDGLTIKGLKIAQFSVYHTSGIRRKKDTFMRLKRPTLRMSGQEAFDKTAYSTVLSQRIKLQRVYG
jgi:hypothetical protein